MTVRSVAEQAAVSPETIYKAFGGKPGLMKELWDVTLAGDDQPVAIADRPQMQEVRSAREPAEKRARQPRAGAWPGKRHHAISNAPASCIPASRVRDSWIVSCR